MAFSASTTIGQSQVKLLRAQLKVLLGDTLEITDDNASNARSIYRLEMLSVNGLLLRPPPGLFCCQYSVQLLTF